MGGPVPKAGHLGPARPLPEAALAHRPRHSLPQALTVRSAACESTQAPDRRPSWLLVGHV